MPPTPFSAADLAELASRGITPEVAAEQLRLYADPPPPSQLLRPCSPGDGIRCLTKAEATGYASRYDEQARSLEVAKFVPASGAASRMFRALLATASDPDLRTREDVEQRAAKGDNDAKAVAVFLTGLRRFAFFEDLVAELERRSQDADDLSRNDVPALLRTLLDEDGLAYASLPKGLLAFHRSAGRVRTAFEEHLIEAATYARGQGGVCRLHFTVSPEHEGRFRDLLERVREPYERHFDVRFDVAFSHQKSSTDSIAVAPDGSPFREDDGRLLLRPAGHGALIENLAEADGELFFVKNIDNVSVDDFLAVTGLWKRALAGVLLELRDAVFTHRRAVETGDSDAVDAALAFVEEAFGACLPEGTGATTAPDRHAFAVAALDRPLRACGMVSSDSNPGGGPFWVRDRNGRSSAQIVETSQVDRDDAGQAAILASARHFNPVDLVCLTRDWKGRPLDLSRFVDGDAVFIAEKSQDGRPLRSLERPGLWNGAMAAWNTVFVEVPIETFHPVKTVNDLLEAAHQGAPSESPGDRA